MTKPRIKISAICLQFYSNYSHTFRLQCLGQELTLEADRHLRKSDRDLLRSLKKDVPGLLARLHPQGHHQEKAERDLGAELLN